MVRTQGTGVFTEKIESPRGTFTESVVISGTNPYLDLGDKYRALAVGSNGAFALWDRQTGPNRIVIASGSKGLTGTQLALGADGNVFIRAPASEGSIPVPEQALHVAGSGLFEGGDVFAQAIVAPTGTYSTSLTVSGSPVRMEKFQRSFLNPGVGVTVSGTAERDLLNVTIPGNSIGPTEQLNFEVLGTFFNDSGTVRTITFRVYWGGSIIYQDVTNSLIPGFCLEPLIVRGALHNLGTTNEQCMYGFVDVGQDIFLGTTAGFGNITATNVVVKQPIGARLLTADTTQDQSLQITVAFSAAHVNLNIGIQKAKVWVSP